MLDSGSFWCQTDETAQLYWALAIATLNSCINGYDGSLMGSINSYPQYRDYFGFDPKAGTPSTGIVYAIYTIGNIVGSFFAGPFTDFRGRLPLSLVGLYILTSQDVAWEWRSGHSSSLSGPSCRRPAAISALSWAAVSCSASGLPLRRRQDRPMSRRWPIQPIEGP